MNRLATLALCLLLPGQLPADTVASEAAGPRHAFKLEKDTGWNVCRDLVKNLNKVQPTKASFFCEIQFHPDMKRFGWPEWTELDIEAHWNEIYAIESYTEKRRTIPPFDSWLEEYRGQIQAGTIHPRLRQTAVRFVSQGPLETVLGYTRERDNTERCKEDWSTNAPQRDATGDHVVLYEPDTRKVRFLVPGDVGAPDGSFTTHALFLYDARAYLLRIMPYAGSFVSRVERFAPANPNIEPADWAKPICAIDNVFLPKF